MVTRYTPLQTLQNQPITTTYTEQLHSDHSRGAGEHKPMINNAPKGYLDQ